MVHYLCGECVRGVDLSEAWIWNMTYYAAAAINQAILLPPFFWTAWSLWIGIFLFYSYPTIT